MDSALPQAEGAGNLFFALAFEEQRERFAESFGEAVATKMFFRGEANADERGDFVVQELHEGDFARANPNSAAVWHYSEVDRNGNGKADFEETMHRTVGSAAIKDGILYIADFSGLFHCVDAKTGKPHWTYDMLSAAWGSPLVVDGKVYIGDEDGDLAIFRHSADPSVAMKDEGGEMVPHYGEISMGNSVYSTPIVAGNILYIANRTHLFAIQNQDE